MGPYGIVLYEKIDIDLFLIIAYSKGLYIYFVTYLEDLEILQLETCAYLQSTVES